MYALRHCDQRRVLPPLREPPPDEELREPPLYEPDDELREPPLYEPDEELRELLPPE